MAPRNVPELETNAKTQLDIARRVECVNGREVVQSAEIGRTVESPKNIG